MLLGDGTLWRDRRLHEYLARSEGIVRWQEALVRDALVAGFF